MPTTIDIYPYPPLPPLGPTDPDPEPISADPMATSTPYIPAATLSNFFDISATRRMTIRVLNNAVGPMPDSSMTVRVNRRLVAFERFNIQVTRRVMMDQVLTLEVTSKRRIVATEFGPEAGLLAHWEFITSTTEDIVGTYDLVDLNAIDGNPFSEPLQLVYDADLDDYAIQFADYETSPTVLNLTPATAFDLFGDTQNWSWKVTFEVKFYSNPLRPTPDHSGDLFKLTNQVRVYTTTESVCINEQWYNSLDEPVAADDPDAQYSICMDYGSSEPTLHLEVNPDWGGSVPEVNYPTTTTIDAWHDIEAEYNATLHRLILRVDGVAQTVDLSSAVDFSNDPTAPELIVGAMAADTRMRNLKFYKLSLVDHQVGWG